MPSHTFSVIGFACRELFPLPIANQVLAHVHVSLHWGGMPNHLFTGWNFNMIMESTPYAAFGELCLEWQQEIYTFLLTKK